MTVKVTKVTEVDGIDANGRPAKMVMVAFTVGEHGPFTQQFTRDEFMGGGINTRLNAFAAQLTGLPGVQ